MLLIAKSSAPRVQSVGEGAYPVLRWCPHWKVADETRAEGLRSIPEVMWISSISSSFARNCSARRVPRVTNVLIDGLYLFQDGDEPVGVTCRLFRTEDGGSGRGDRDATSPALHDAVTNSAVGLLLVQVAAHEGQAAGNDKRCGD